MGTDQTKLEWLEYDLLENYPNLLHGTFSRHGGVSEKHCKSLNLGESVSDNPDHVRQNRELVRKAIGVPKVIYAHQNHGVNVHRVTAKNLDQLPQADALYTTERNLGLGITHADCQAALFYDPVHEAIAAVHSGWRGSAQNIYARVIETMQREIGTQPHNLIVCISPSLGPDHAEFKNFKQELPKTFWEYQKRPNFFDFWAISRMQLEACGVLPRNIELAEICTHCNTDDYFSHRAEKDTGRNATVIAMKP